MPHIRTIFVLVTAFFLGMTACKDKNTLPTYPSGQETPLANAAFSPRVLLNGVQMQFTEMPYFRGSNLMVEAKPMLIALGYKVSWDSINHILTATRQATNTAGAQTIQIQHDVERALVNNAGIILPVKSELKSGKLMVMGRFLAEKGGAAIVEWDMDSESLQLYFYEVCDYGIYFYGVQPQNSDAVGAEKFVAGVANRFFDPSKPTIIYTHGWQLNGVKNKGREDFRLNGSGVDIQTHNYWIAQGWNVGIFQWVQLADDGGVPPPREAEAKIYDTQNTLSNFRWKNTNGNFQTPTISQNLMQLYATEYEKVFGNGYTGSKIHLMGNSLGGNLTMALLMELHQQQITPFPQRVTLIDPYWSLNLNQNQVNFPYGYTSAYIIAKDAAIFAAQQHNTAIEYYRTSIAGTVGSNDSLIAYTAFSHLGTDFTWNAVTKHTTPVRQYMWSYQFAPPIEIYRPNAFTNFTPTGNVAASAATPDSRIRELMGRTHYWNHVEGRNTVTPEDDKFEIREGLY